MPFRLSDIRFAPTIIPTMSAFCASLLLLYLGHWQQGRAEEKRALQIEFDNRSAAPPIVLGAEIRDPVALRFVRAIARGEWQEKDQIFLDNKFDNESVGFHVITPLKLEGKNRYALVNRGWVARGPGYPIPPSTPAPQGFVTVEGNLSLPSSRFLELAEATVQGNVWQNLTVDRYRKAKGLDVLPLVLLATTPSAPLRPVSEQADARVEKHVEYMLTWYSLAATVIVLWIVLNVEFKSVLPNRASSNSEDKA